MPFSCRRRRRSARWAAGEGPAGCAGWPAGEPACRAGALLARAAVAGPKPPSALTHTPPALPAPPAPALPPPAHANVLPRSPRPLLARSPPCAQSRRLQAREGPPRAAVAAAAAAKLEEPGPVRGVPRSPLRCALCIRKGSPRRPGLQAGRARRPLGAGGAAGVCPGGAGLGTGELTLHASRLLFCLALFIIFFLSSLSLSRSLSLARSLPLCKVQGRGAARLEEREGGV